MLNDVSPKLQKSLRRASRIVHEGLDPGAFHGFVNPPVVHASTVLFPDVETMLSRGQKYTYGRSGTPTMDALVSLVSALEGAENTVLAPTGLAACTLALGAVVESGDHVIVVDNIYNPTRVFCDNVLTKYDITTTYVDPCDLEAYANAFQRKTAAVFLEAPGSLTFEVPDVPKMAAMAREAGAVSIMDNTWATPVFFRPLEHGVDLSIQAATKYFGGHSDLLLGTIAGNGELIAKVRKYWDAWGMHVAPDDINLTIRGMRTLDVRLERHERNARLVAEWLSAHKAVSRVLYPALPDAPGHELWKRDFSGATGLFGITFEADEFAPVATFINALRLFGIGASWGGFESLVVPARLDKARSVTKWSDKEFVVRLHVGLEDPQDLIEDLERALSAAFGA